MQLSAAETILALQAEVLALTAERDAALATLYVRNAEYDALALTLQLRDDQVVRTQRALMQTTAEGAFLRTALEDAHRAVSYHDLDGVDRILARALPPFTDDEPT